jgi:hypothetical protein
LSWGLPLLPSAAASPARFVFCFKKKLALAAAGVTQGQIEKNRTLPRQGCSFVNCPPPVSGPVPLAKQCTWHRFMSDEGFRLQVRASDVGSKPSCMLHCCFTGCHIHKGKRCNARHCFTCFQAANGQNLSFHDGLARQEVG